MRAWLRKCVNRFQEASPLMLASGLALLCLPAVVALAWVSTDMLERSRIEAAIQRHTVQMARQLTDSEADLEAAFTRIRSITTWLAEEGHALSAIKDPRNVLEANVFFQGIASSFGLDLIYIMDARGISVAASNWDTPSSTLGQDYSDREHFQAALTGIPAQQFAVGRTTRSAGFFFGMPVRDGSAVVGTIGVKLDQPRLEHLVRLSGSVITDEYGVVVLAENPKYLLQALPDAKVFSLSETQRQVRYGRTEFEPLPVRAAGFAQYPDIRLLDGRPVLVGSRAMIDTGLEIHMASDFRIIRDIREQHDFIFVVGIVATTLLIWGLWLAVLYFLHARHYRKRLELANQQLFTLNSELQEQATHDFLTGAYNRRAFTALLRNELERVKRYGGDLSLGIIDVDHFKRINDTRGHAVGDQALKFLVNHVSHNMRRSDVLARLGGEEFVLLMPNTPLNEAAQVLDRMRESIATQAVPGQVPELHFTFSAGVTGWHPGIDERGMLNAADEALYSAKGGGRNRVVISAGNDESVGKVASSG